MAETTEQRIDITGNWYDLAVPASPGIRTSEPWLRLDETNVFEQRLQLQKGAYSIELRYDPLTDKRNSYALEGTLSPFSGLRVNGESCAIEFAYKPETAAYIGRYSFAILEDGLQTFHLALRNTRVMRTLLFCHSDIPGSPHYFALPPYADNQGEIAVIQGIPFQLRTFTSTFSPANLDGVTKNEDAGELIPWREDGVFLDCGDTSVDTAYFLGMIHRYDIANGSWYSAKGDHGYSHFAGDPAGVIKLEWTDGGTFDIPLIFGYNLWFSRPWDMLWHYSEYVAGVGGENFDDTLFFGQGPCSREIVQDSLMLSDGIRLMGSNTCNARYIFAIRLNGRKVRSIRLTGSPELHGYPVISAVTLSSSSASSLPRLPAITEAASPIKWTDLSSIENRSFEQPLHSLQRLLYTFTDELPELTEPAIPQNYFGPSYDFRGSREAMYAASYLYFNGPECASHIADSGTGCASSTSPWVIPHYTIGIGVWLKRKARQQLPDHLQDISRDHKLYALYDGLQEWFQLYRLKKPGDLPGLNDAWTRGAGQLLREAMAFGYDKFTDTYTDWLDHVLFTEATPPHWNRIAGDPKRAFKRVMIGGTEETGNRENDGHGICMWGRYMVWHWKGRPREWNERHWEATKAAVEWIQWQLDVDTIYPGVRKDVLFTQSEPAHSTYDIYSSYNCLHGIKLAIRMAEQLGKHEEIRQWNELYGRLRSGILEHLTEQSEFGAIWYTSPACDWADHAHKLVHVLLATEGDSYTPLQYYGSMDEEEQRYLELDLNSYQYLMKDKNYDCLRMYGYGQGFMAQAALLLDQMEDAEQFINMLVRHCYLPNMGYWTSPEGIIRHRSGQFYVPVKAYMGQDSHVADSTKAVRLMLGVDDNDPQHLKLVPRFPVSWTRMSISEFPVLTGSTRQHLHYLFERTAGAHTFTYRLEEDAAELSVRLGPLPKGSTIRSVLLNEQIVNYEIMNSGDSSWVWICTGERKEGMIRLLFDVL